MSAINLEQNIAAASTMNALRNTLPKYDGQRIFLTEYYAGKGKGGGVFTGYLNIANAIDDGGYSTVIVNQSTAVWRRNDLTQLSLYDGGCDPTLSDNSSFIQNISLIQGERSVKIPSGYWNIAKPVIFPANRGIALYGENNFNGRAVLTYSGPDLTDISDVSGVITVSANAGEMTHSGINFRNFQIRGNNKIISGLSIKYAGYVQVQNVSILYCKGAGLYLDKVQDSYFKFLEVQGCGRTSGDYNSYTDITDYEKMLLAPVHLTSTIKDDDCNMLRFEDCQWEANLISPTIYIHGGIGLWFTKLHMEHRSGPLKTLIGENTNASRLLHMNSGEVYLNEIQASEVNDLVYSTGYGVLYVTNINRAGNITHAASGKRFNIFMSGCWLQDMNFSSSVKAMISNSWLANLTWSHPSYPSTISDTYFSGNVALTGDGANTRIDLADCQYGSVNCNTSNLRFLGGRCLSDFRYASLSGAGSVIDVDVEGATTISTSYGSSYQPGKSSYSVARVADVPKELGSVMRPIGSEWFNTAVTGDQEGAIYSWVKTAAGWRPNSRISRFGTNLSSMTFSQLPAAISCKGTVIFCTNTAASPSAQAIISDGADWIYLATPGTKVTAAH
ncbi:hypothetical protein [Serratia plymuthica]|uniref:Tail spike TSP1/Gp66 N-terminal domain-containing protein n=2 Tax=Serratia plymuthica TaxID=82996 RepID=A0A7T2WBQ6_SERPL|nr:hypothetical protein [Serratia plymuthica]QPS20653.1 hypothetical protein I6G64_24410 [Serratia plymuthica]QPS62266.1 hypothetical protein I6G52_19670 [Serratia plymuthica]RKS65450.1 hypothetical protein C8E17_4814 [Serratia plymuthica]CAI2519896.1 Uncharacterised protein [Serratia plymuthica]